MKTREMRFLKGEEREGRRRGHGMWKRDEEGPGSEEWKPQKAAR